VSGLRRPSCASILVVCWSVGDDLTIRSPKDDLYRIALAACFGSCIEVLLQGLGQGTSYRKQELAAKRRMLTPLAHDPQIDQNDDDRQGNDEYDDAIEHHRDRFPHISSPAEHSANRRRISRSRSEPDPDR